MPAAKPGPRGQGLKRLTRKSRRRRTRSGERLGWILVGAVAGILVSGAWAFAESAASRGVWRSLAGAADLLQTAATPAAGAPAAPSPAVLAPAVRNRVSSAAQTAVDQALTQPLPGSGGVVLPGAVRQIVSQAVGQALAGGLAGASGSEPGSQLRPVSQESGPGFAIKTYASVQRFSVP